jgi:hypothetical protein
MKWIAFLHVLHKVVNVAEMSTPREQRYSETHTNSCREVEIQGSIAVSKFLEGNDTYRISPIFICSIVFGRCGNRGRQAIRLGAVDTSTSYHSLRGSLFHALCHMFLDLSTMRVNQKLTKKFEDLIRS